MDAPYHVVYSETGAQFVPTVVNTSSVQSEYALSCLLFQTPYKMNLHANQVLRVLVAPSRATDSTALHVTIRGCIEILVTQ